MLWWGIEKRVGVIEEHQVRVDKLLGELRIALREIRGMLGDGKGLRDQEVEIYPGLSEDQQEELAELRAEVEYKRRRAEIIRDKDG